MVFMAMGHHVQINSHQFGGGRDGWNHPVHVDAGRGGNSFTRISEIWVNRDQLAGRTLDYPAILA
jgi:hypothetical protein